MEIDKEVDGQLAQLARRMDCMGTEDEETLVRNFQQILGPQADLSADLCRFFLDMNNWNLQAALGSFYDHNAQQMVVQSLPSMQFIADVTIGEGQSVQPNLRFLKTWRIMNNGTEQWPLGCSLRRIEGESLADVDHVDVDALRVGETADVSVTMTSPVTQGVYQSRWHMFNGAGVPFGETIWCILVVDDNGLLDLTQRFASTNCGNEQQLQPSNQWAFGGGGGEQSDGSRSQQRNPFQSGIKHEETQQQANFEATTSYYNGGINRERESMGAICASLPISTHRTVRRQSASVNGDSGNHSRMREEPYDEFWNEQILASINDSRLPGQTILSTDDHSRNDVDASSSSAGASCVIQPLQPLFRNTPPSPDDNMEN